VSEQATNSKGAQSSTAARTDLSIQTAPQVTDVEKIRALPWQIVAGMGNGIFCVWTVFGPVFVLFLNELGIDKTRIGFILSLISFCGILAVFTAPVVARIGLKRIVVACYGLRKIVVALLILTPMLLNRFGTGVAFAWVAGVVLVFAILRSLAETAFTVWTQELIPNYMRGKFTAVSGIMSNVAIIAATLLASFVVGHFTGMGRFLVLIGAGSFIGLASVICYLFLPGGGPVRPTKTESTHFADMIAAFRDRNFRILLGGVGLIWFALTAMGPFVYLFVKEKVGLASDKVVLLQSCIFAGMLLSSYLWGWASDRYGSKPILLLGAFLTLLFPICWFLIPRNHSASLYLALAIALSTGIGRTGWSIGHIRYFFNTALSLEKKTAYSAIWYAWISISMATGPLLAGKFLDWTGSVNFKYGIFSIDSYSLLFEISFVLLLIAVLLLRRIKADSGVSTGGFVSMFFQGNPFMAFSSLIRFHLAKSETDRAASAERMGRARNPLGIEELIQALADPSFNVRYEAIVSIAHMRPHPKLLDALLGVLASEQADLSINAAWALGKLGDKNAVVPLREMLLSEYPLLRARSARALAMLGDNDSESLLLQGLAEETDHGVRMAYAAALGQLRSTEALPTLLSYLRELSDKTFASELALAIGRIAGREHRYIRLWRDLHYDLPTHAAQAVLSIRKDLTQHRGRYAWLSDLFNECAHSFAKNNTDQAIKHLIEIAQKLEKGSFSETSAAIIIECIAQLTEFGLARKEYLVLILHTLISEGKMYRRSTNIKGNIS